ncbi:hypothetical protein NPS53_09000 [Pseudomonas putida]|uniref:hypothetical protein n=1 Tax=Pseudomonas putida TaxID=303 RepID=UPI0023632276|nr:hypothetical protein [Pseudomonas putida]MDD2139712.1 hypothetical protein [Pseudomonas putida]HDS1721636.1 hypothetical protein [Pseudomonas putida]
MTDNNWLSLMLLVAGASLILIEAFAFTLKLLVLGITACLMALACYLWDIPIWGLIAFGIAGLIAQIIMAKRFPRAKGIPASDVIGAAGFVSSVQVRDGITYAVISFSTPIGGFEQWNIKQTGPLMNQRRARVLKVNDDSTLTVELEGEPAK